jgi:holliday junction DNA helicase RuvA
MDPLLFAGACMIVKIHGVLEEINSGHAYLALPGGLTYEVLVSSWTGARMGASIGQPVTLYTLHYIEGQNSGSTAYPRLAGFLSLQDKRFFELFTSVNGIGYRTALAAMALSSDRIATAIAERDAAMLQGLPKIGKRTAETIIATLHGKVEGFVSPGGSPEEEVVEAAPVSGAGAGKKKGKAPAAVVDKAADAKLAKRREISRDALDLISGLGENRAQVMVWIEAVMEAEPELVDQNELIAKALAQRESGRRG